MLNIKLKKMKKNSFFIRLVILLSLIVFLYSCSNSSDDSVLEPISNLPVLTTNVISNISANSCMSGGTITSDGGSPVTSRGVVWSINQSPIINNSITSNGTGVGSFASNITSLIANTTYYVRAYATNSNGTSYGNQITFTTQSLPVGPFFAKVNGVEFVEFAITVNTTTLNNAPGISISCIDANNHEIDLEIRNDAVVGTVYQNTTNPFTDKFNFDYYHPTISTNTIPNGSLTITQRTATKLKGQFYFDSVNSSFTNLFHITEGYFDVTLP
jgi:hypothetical protein